MLEMSCVSEAKRETQVIGMRAWKMGENIGAADGNRKKKKIDGDGQNKNDGGALM